ncbi:MAG TPA: hypothetical protein VIK41_27475 [Gemmatimonadaceae bacterium]
MSALVSREASTTITSELFPSSAARTDSMQRRIDRADSTDAMIIETSNMAIAHWWNCPSFLPSRANAELGSL